MSLGNIASGVIGSLAVDAITDGLYKLEPELLSTTMVREQCSVKNDNEGLYVETVSRTRV